MKPDFLRLEGRIILGSYLVTGAAGFIGAAVAKKMVDLGHKVVTIDNLSTGEKEHIPDGVEFIEGSTFDKCVIDKLGDRSFEAIIHIAGQSSGEISFEDPVYDLQTNCQSTLLLLEYARKTGCKKFLYASTMSVYGDHTPPECFENTELMPKSFYAVGKLASEHYMRIYARQFDITCTALRLFNTYGIGQNMSNMKQGMASIYLSMAIKNHKITVKGSKDRFRDFVYIDDVVDAFLKALSRTDGYDCINICTEKSTTVEKVIHTIVSQFPDPIEVNYVEGTPGDQFGIYGNNKKAKETINWEPNWDFEVGMKTMIDWAVEVV